MIDNTTSAEVKEMEINEYGIVYEKQMIYGLNDLKCRIVEIHGDRVPGLCFKDNSCIEKVILVGVQVIGHGAFKNCAKLKEIVILDIDADGKLKENYSLEDDSLEEIAPSAFENCSQLCIVSFPKVRKVGTVAFAGCPHMTTREDLNLPEDAEVAQFAFGVSTPED